MAFLHFLHFLHFPHDLCELGGRLANPDAPGLTCLLQGWGVVALTKDTAVIETATGTVSYRQHNKPALGPLGDSLGDFAPESEAIAADNSEVTT